MSAVRPFAIRCRRLRFAALVCRRVLSGARWLQHLGRYLRHLTTLSLFVRGIIPCEQGALQKISAHCRAFFCFQLKRRSYSRSLYDITLHSNKFTFYGLVWLKKKNCKAQTKFCRCDFGDRAHEQASVDAKSALIADRTTLIAASRAVRVERCVAQRSRLRECSASGVDLRSAR